MTLLDLELNPMTLVIKLLLDIVKLYSYVKFEVSRSSGSKARAHIPDFELDPMTSLDLDLDPMELLFKTDIWSRRINM